jgi:hypothetical protein
MLDLLLVGMFTAFFLAALSPLVDFISFAISGMLVNALLSLVFSGVANFLINNLEVKNLILWTVAGAFLGSALLAAAERLATYKPAVINQVR